MAIKVIAQRREVKLGKNPGMKFVRRPDLYIPIQEKKVFAEASSQNQGENGQSSQGGQSQQATGYALTINKSGTGSASVTHNGNAVASGSSLSEDDEVEISITPAEGKVPTASVNGSSIELTEDGGVYSGSFAMPGQASSLVINTGTADGGGGLTND